MSTTYRKSVVHRSITYTIEMETDVIADPLMHQFTVKNDSGTVIWQLVVIDNNLERTDDEAVKVIKRDIDSRLDGASYFANRMTAIGYS